MRARGFAIDHRDHSDLCLASAPAITKVVIGNRRTLRTVLRELHDTFDRTKGVLRELQSAICRHGEIEEHRAGILWERQPSFCRRLGGAG